MDEKDLKKIESLLENTKPKYLKNIYIPLGIIIGLLIGIIL